MAKTIVLNLQQLRADRSVNAPIIVGPDGKEYAVGGVPLDVFLAIVELQQTYFGGDQKEVPLEIFTQFKVLIECVLPGFPAGDLTIEELMAVIDAMQLEIGPQSTGEAGNSEPGELTPP